MLEWCLCFVLDSLHAFTQLHTPTPDIHAHTHTVHTPTPDIHAHTHTVHTPTPDIHAHTHTVHTPTPDIHAHTHNAHTYSNIDLINSSTRLKCLSIGHLSCHCLHPVGLIYGILLLLLLRLQQATQRCSASVCKKKKSLKDGLVPRPFGTRLTEGEASVFLGRLRKPFPPPTPFM